MSTSRSDEVQSHIVTISIDNPKEVADDGFQEAACRVAAEHVRREAQWFHVVSDAWLCTQLTYAYIRMAEACDFVATPTFLYQGEVIAGESLDDMLGSRGLLRRRGLLFSDGTEGLSSDLGEDEAASGTIGTVRGSSLGL